MSSLEKCVFRPFIILCVPGLFLACIGGAAWVLVATREPLLAASFAVVALAPERLLRCVIMWLSTPAERRAINSILNRRSLKRKT